MKPTCVFRWSSHSPLARLLCALIAVGVVVPESWAQNATPAFDVVSIRENRVGGTPKSGPTADGYHLKNSPLAMAILTAYVPQSGKIAFYTPDLPGLPDWAKQARFDIDAKGGEIDLAKWQEPDSQTSMLRSMLQAMLTDRFKLAVHRQMRDLPVFFLEVGKNGPKLKNSTPGETHPNGKRLPGNAGVLLPDEANKSVHFYETTMAAMAAVISDLTGRPVQDRTGLTGRYDFDMVTPAREGGGDPMTPGDSGPTVFRCSVILG